MFDVKMRALAEVKNQIESAREGGLAKGMEIGLEKGMEMGLEKGMEMGVKKGREEGVEIGRLESARIIARSLLDVLDISTIAERTGLSIAELESLKEQR